MYVCITIGVSYADYYLFVNCHIQIRLDFHAVSLPVSLPPLTLLFIKLQNSIISASQHIL